MHSVAMMSCWRIGRALLSTAGWRRSVMGSARIRGSLTSTLPPCLFFPFEPNDTQWHPWVTQLKQDLQSLIVYDDIAWAIKHSGTSAPGPDNLPYEAWRLSGDIGVDILWKAALALQQDDNIELLQATMPIPSVVEHAHLHDFNHSLLICLGKKRIPNDGPWRVQGATAPLGALKNGA